MEDFSLAELRAFDATARCGSMSGAARQLGFRQPTISVHIANLEHRFGVELFHRRGQRVELTEFGVLLKEISNRVFRAEEEAAALLLGARAQYVGKLQIGAVGPYNVMPMLARFRARHPNVHVAVSVGDSRSIVRRIGDYQGDLGVVLHAVDDPRFHCVPYRRQRLLVFAPLGHPLAARGSVRLADLEGQEFVLREEGSSTRRAFEQALGEAGVRIRSSLQMGSREAVREAVAQGLGLGVVADTAFLPDPRLVALEVEGSAMHTHSHVICLRERRHAPLIVSFLEVVDALRAGAGSLGAGA